MLLDEDTKVGAHMAPVRNGLRSLHEAVSRYLQSRSVQSINVDRHLAEARFLAGELVRAVRTVEAQRAADPSFDAGIDLGTFWDVRDFVDRLVPVLPRQVPIDIWKTDPPMPASVRVALPVAAWEPTLEERRTIGFLAEWLGAGKLEEASPGEKPSLGDEGGRGDGQAVQASKLDRDSLNQEVAEVIRMLRDSGRKISAPAIVGILRKRLGDKTPSDNTIKRTAAWGAHRRDNASTSPVGRRQARERQLTKAMSDNVSSNCSKPIDELIQSEERQNRLKELHIFLQTRMQPDELAEYQALSQKQRLARLIEFEDNPAIGWPRGLANERD